jgi:hypothetical protein
MDCFVAMLVAMTKSNQRDLGGPGNYRLFNRFRALWSVPRR